MIKMLVMCGSGIATSTVVTGKVSNWLKENNYDSQVKLYKGKVADELPRLDSYDVVISTTIVPDKYKDSVINAVNLITGRDTDSVYEKIEEAIKNKL